MATTESYTAALAIRRDRLTGALRMAGFPAPATAEAPSDTATARAQSRAPYSMEQLLQMMGQPS